MDDAAAASSLEAKVCVLLKNKGPHEEECTLVALVLMTGMDQDAFERVWLRQRLNRFVEKLLLVPSFVPLAARLIPRINDDDDCLKWANVCESLLESDLVSIDVIDAMRHCLGKCVCKPFALGKRVLEHVWKHFYRANNNNNNKDLEELHETVILLWQDHACWICSMCVDDDEKLLPPWYPSMVEWVSSKPNLPTESLRPMWHVLVFGCTQILVPSNVMMVVGLTELILAHIAAPEPSSSYAKKAAWETAAILIQNQTLSQIRIVTRLAAGEWRMQLEMDDDKQQLLQPCGQVVLGAIQKVVDMDEIDDPNVLLHLRQSFLEVLDTTIWFYTVSSNTTLEVCDRVMGALLAEISIWDELPGSVDRALRAIMRADLVTMLPCLVHTIMSAAQEESRLLALEKHGLLGVSMLDNLISNLDNRDVLLWTCRAIQAWCLCSRSLESLEAQRRSLLAWMDTSPSPEMVDAYWMLTNRHAGGV